MGYACPVCEDPQADAEHLANHLAFTAMTGGADHEDWLDEHVPDWGQRGETELAEQVVAYADEQEFPQVFEASGVEGGEHGYDHEHSHGEGGIDTAAARERGTGGVEDADEVIEEARELTRQMRESEASEERGDEDSDSDGAAGEETSDGDAETASGDETQ